MDTSPPDTRDLKIIAMRPGRTGNSSGDRRPIKSHRRSWPILAVLCGLLFGCSESIPDERPSTNGEAASQNSSTSAEPEVGAAEKDAIRAILALVENDSEEKKVLTFDSDGHVVRADLSGMAAVNDQTLAHLAALPELEELSLQRCSITDQSFAGLAQMRNLTRIRAAQTVVSDSGLEHLKGKTQLRRLSLRATVVGNEGLAYLKTLGNLQRLDLSETIVGNEGLTHIKALPKLADLNLWATRVGDEGMSHLMELTNLRKLNLEDVGFPREGVSLTSQGVRQLEALQNLEWLNLGKTEVCDEGIVALGNAARISIAQFERLPGRDK